VTGEISGKKRTMAGKPEMVLFSRPIFQDRDHPSDLPESPFRGYPISSPQTRASHFFVEYPLLKPIIFKTSYLFPIFVLGRMLRLPARYIFVAYLKFLPMNH